MADGRHIENRFLAISQRYIVRLMQNLVRGSRIMFRHRSRDQNTKFHKFKMSDGCHFENGFIAISQLRIIDFQWDLVCWRRFLLHSHVTKYQNLQFQNGVQPPYWKSFMATSQRFIVRLMRNLVWGSTIMFDTGRLTKYQISKILDVWRPPFWKLVLLLRLGRGSSDFNEILCRCKF